MSDKDSVAKQAAPAEGSKTDKRKQSLYFPESMLQEIKEEAARLDRSLSWIVQRAWKLARLEIKKLPSVNDVEGGDDDEALDRAAKDRMTKSPETSPILHESFAEGADGTKLYVRQRAASLVESTASPASARVSALFSDGILCDGFIWKYLWDAVAERMDVAHWHYRGHGRSALPVNPDAIDIAAHARDLDAVRKHIGDPDVVLFGHSMGCQVALEGYRLRPKGVRGLVLLCGSYGRVTETFKGSNMLSQMLPRIIDTVLASPNLARALWSRIPPEMALKIALLTGDVDEKTIRPEDMLPYLQHLTHVDFPMFLRMLRAAGEHSAEDLLPSIACPVLIVAGEKDGFTPSYLAEQMHEKIPGSELFVVPGGTHVAPLEQRDLVNLRIDKFLRDRTLG